MLVSKASDSLNSVLSTPTRKLLSNVISRSEIQQNREQTQENMAQVRATLNAFQEEF